MRLRQARPIVSKPKGSGLNGFRRMPAAGGMALSNDQSSNTGPQPLKTI
jgi:hypothetical protein